MQAVVVTDEADPEAAAAKVLPPKAHKTSLWRWCALALVVAGVPQLELEPLLAPCRLQLALERQLVEALERPARARAARPSPV